jgi:putative restriction endonuclease
VSADGPNSVTNGILLRADVHRLFDKGYITIDTEHRLIISKRLKDEFNNGRTYYPLHGSRLRDPHMPEMRPQTDHLTWHNEHVFLG